MINHVQRAEYISSLNKLFDFTVIGLRRNDLMSTKAGYIYTSRIIKIRLSQLSVDVLFICILFRYIYCFPSKQKSQKPV